MELEVDRRHAFNRPLVGRRIESGCTPVLAVLFLVGSVAFGLTAVEAGDFDALLFVALFLGGLGVVFAVRSAEIVRNGVPAVAVEVGPSGLWLPDLGWLAWDGIEEIRLERLMSRAARTDASQVRRRIGIVPRDATLKAERPWSTRGARLLYRMYFRRFNRYTQGPAVELAPFGVMEDEVAGGLDPVLAAIREHRAVVNQPGALGGMS